MGACRAHDYFLIVGKLRFPTPLSYAARKYRKSPRRNFGAGSFRGIEIELTDYAPAAYQVVKFGMLSAAYHSTNMSTDSRSSGSFLL